MSARLLLCGSLIFACGLAVLFAAAAVSADPPKPSQGVPAAPPAGPPVFSTRDEPGPAPSKEEIKKRAAELRKKYPFESLSKRLAYEDRFAAESKSGPAPELNEEAMKHLETLEVSGSGRWGAGTRTRALEMLHSEQVERFISREGFGLSRLPQPTVQSLELANADPVRYPRYLLESTENDKAEFVSPPRPNSSDANPWKLPARDFLLNYHLVGQLDFVGPLGLGLVRDRDHVAGFKPHQFRSLPQMVTKWDRDPNATPAGPPVRVGAPLPPPKPVEEWTLRRLELVSLLKHEKPAVYVSATLPKMDDLENAETRRLSSFEADSLKALRSGESLVARATPNHLEMVGALRAGKQCQACHQVQRGELLGAFSYELHRAPEFKLGKSAAASGG